MSKINILSTVAALFAFAAFAVADENHETIEKVMKEGMKGDTSPMAKVLGGSASADETKSLAALVKTMAGTKAPEGDQAAYEKKVSELIAAMDAVAGGDKGEAAIAYFGDGATSDGDFHVGVNFAGVYRAAVARAHFDRRSALLAQPFEPNNFAWTWDGDGLMPVAVPTEAFHAVMGMQAARAALQAAASNAQALALFVANDLRREAVMGESPDPVSGDRRGRPVQAAVGGRDGAGIGRRRKLRHDRGRASCGESVQSR
jgi:hypothetical protein